MRIRLKLLPLFLLASCANLPAVKSRTAGLSAPPPAAASAPVAAAPAGPALSVEIEGSSRDETKRGFRLGLAGNAPPTLREDEALRMVEAALRAEGYSLAAVALGSANAGLLNIKARFSKESSRFGFFSAPKHAVHLEAFENDRLVWEYHAEAAGEGDDIRPLLPTLLAAGRGIIGSSTAGKRTVSLETVHAPARTPVAETAPAPAKRSARRGLLQN